MRSARAVTPSRLRVSSRLLSRNDGRKGHALRREPSAGIPGAWQCGLRLARVVDQSVFITIGPVGSPVSSDSNVTIKPRTRSA